MAKNDSTQTGDEQGGVQMKETPESQNEGLPKTVKPEGEGLTETNAGPDAKEGTIADQPEEPEEAK